MHPSLALCLLLTSAATAQVAINDTFDRPDSGNLGVDWIKVENNAVIQGGALIGKTSNFGWALNTVYDAPYPSTVAKAHFSVSGPVGVFGLIIGARIDKFFWEGVEARLCDCDGDGRMESLLFNSAPNAGGWFGSNPYHTLAAPMAAGTMKMWFSDNGDTLHVELRDASTGNVESFSDSGILSSPFVPTGRGVGISYYSNAYVDDFQAWTGEATDVPFTLTPPRVGLPASYLVTGATANSVVGLFISLTGAGPLPTPVGLLQLSLPVYSLAALPTDAAGRAELPIGAIPPFPGLPLYLQAIDAGTLTLTNGFVATIQ